jgi:hypothetical protein
MEWTDIGALIACAIGGGLGGYAMINPVWASKLVRLVPAEGKVEGKSEFRATYGGQLRSRARRWPPPRSVLAGWAQELAAWFR